MSQIGHQSIELSPRMTRLDNMLVAEGVAGPDRGDGRRGGTYPGGPKMVKNCQHCWAIESGPQWGSQVLLTAVVKLLEILVAMQVTTKVTQDPAENANNAVKGQFYRTLMLVTFAVVFCVAFSECD